jgi:competence protein ComEC
MSKSRIFFYCVCGFLLGIALRSYFNFGRDIAYLLAISSLIMLALSYRNKKILIIYLVGIFLSLGIWISDKEIAVRTNGKENGKTISQQALVTSNPVQKNGYEQIILEMENTKIHAIANVPQYGEISYGDRVEVNCELQIPENRDAKFDYRMYLAKDHVEYICNKAKLKKISTVKNKDIFVILIAIKKYFESNLYKLIPQPEGALAGGIIFGGSGGLSQDLQDSFSRTGTTHIIAVSGYNVTIVAEYFLLLGLFFGLWRKQALWFAIVGIVLFVIMVGMPASAVRAGVMSSIVLWAMKNGRLATSTNAIIFAAALMLLLNPLLLRWDIGFQLSFAATIGVVICSDLWQKSRFSKFQMGGLTEIIILTLGAQIFVWPIIAYNFQSFSVISLVANVLVLPLIPISMLLVFLAAMSSFFAPYNRKSVV